jgi:hypothetical protein
MTYQPTRDAADHPRVVIIVRGGVAEYLKDEGVDVCLVDYDNEPDGELPAKYQDLLSAES